MLCARGGAKGLLDLAYHRIQGCTYMRLELDAVNCVSFQPAICTEDDWISNLIPL